MAEQNGEFGRLFDRFAGRGRAVRRSYLVRWLIGRVVKVTGGGGGCRGWCSERNRGRGGRGVAKGGGSRGGSYGGVVVFGGSGWSGDAGWSSGGENGGAQPVMVVVGGGSNREGKQGRNVLFFLFY
ncbi:glycine-rich RNA-binding protein 7-like [Spinacia oleracea]|uniref:Glycine-rich RNA-binding protein 7-like n=1 Tax=Spinacia oleracea TaxID=3562 RepID=A0ABM3QY51_SPIOL|nr:glycine-rich RNA-binding protein 7-like [Spinacia oleracea]